MRFDNIAMAANTPGGFQAGVNDIVQALMGAKRQQAQQAFQEAQMQQQMAIADRSFGAEQAQQLSSNAFREREISANELRAKTDDRQATAKIQGDALDRAGSFAAGISDRLFGKPGVAGSGGMKPMTYSDQLAQTKYKDELTNQKTTAAREAADRKAGITKGQVSYEENEPILTGILQDKQLVVEGKPQFKKVTRSRLASAAEYAQSENVYQGLMNPQFKADQDSQFRGEVIPPQRQASGTPGMGTAVAQSLAPNTGATNGLSQNEAQETQAHTIAESLMPPMLRNPIDYAAEDLKLQAEYPEYKQLRSNPSYNWKGAVDEAVRQRAQQPR